MENRFKEMDEFLKSIAFYAKNKDEKSYKNYIYSKLCLYNLTKEEIGAKQNLLEIQSRICQDFGFHPFVECNIINGKLIYKNLGNTNNNTEGEENNKSECINLYIPINNKNGFVLLNSLFDYIERELIESKTEVLKNIRTDNVVVKLYSNDNAIKIAEFVNKNHAEDIINNNPFMINDENVGLSIEGNISYLNSVAYFINDYIIELKNKNELDNCNLNGFKQHIENLKQNDYLSIIKDENIVKMKKNFHLDISNETFKCQIINIIDLIQIATDEEKGLADFDKKWEEVRTNQYNNASSVDNLKNKENEESNKENLDEIENSSIEEKDSEEDDEPLINPIWDNAKNDQKGDLYKKYFNENNQLVVYKNNNIFKKIINFFKKLFTKGKSVEEI